MHADGRSPAARAMARKSAGETEYGACGTIDGRSHARGISARARLRGGNELLRLLRVEPDHSRKTAPPQRTVREKSYGRQGLRHVPHERRAGSARLADRFTDRRRRVRRGFTPDRQQPRRPRGHRAARRDAVAHPRKLQMCVGVDEPGQDHGLAKVGDFDRRAVTEGGRVAVPARDDAALAGEHPAAPQRAGGDRQHPGGRLQDQGPVRRAFFSGSALAALPAISGGREVSPSARATASASIAGRSALGRRKNGSPCSS